MTIRTFPRPKVFEALEYARKTYPQYKWSYYEYSGRFHIGGRFHIECRNRLLEVQAIRHAEMAFSNLDVDWAVRFLERERGRDLKEMPR